MFRTILLELFLPFRPFKQDSEHPMDKDFCTDLKLIGEQNKMAGCSYEKKRRGS